jgi:hypothetical protein
MSYERFSSWDSGEGEPNEEFVAPIEDQIESDPEGVAEFSNADEIISELKSLDVGDSYRVETSKDVFNEVYSFFIKNKLRKCLPVYQNGKYLVFEKKQDF